MLEEFKKKKIAVSCTTVIESKHLFAFLIYNGINQWCSNEPLSLEETCWDNYEKETVYGIAGGGLSFGTKFSFSNVKIVSYLEFIQNLTSTTILTTNEKLGLIGSDFIPLFTHNYECKWNINKGENTNMQTERIIDLWYKREKAKIEEEYDEKYNEILFDDADVVEVKQHYEAICELAKTRGVSSFTNGFIINYRLLTSDATDVRLTEVEKEKDFRLMSLRVKYEEIRIMVSACENYEQEIDVLKAYKIIDETGKLSV